MNMKVKFSIGFKMAVAIALGLFAVISVFSHTSVRMSEKKLLSMAEGEASKVSNAIKSSLENAMLSGKREGIQVIIDSVAKENMVRDIKIIDYNAQVKYAKRHGDINTQLDQSSASCRLCHHDGVTNRKNLTVIFTAEDGSRVLRNVNPIHNKEICHECHDQSIDILGKLLVDFTTKDIDQMVVDNRKLLIFSATATLLASIILCFILAGILVKQPLSKLLAKMQYAGDGKDDTIIHGKDEIDILDSTYDSLMAAIEARNAQIKQQMSELMAMFNVSEILNQSGSIFDNFNMILKALSLGFNVRECAIFAVSGTGELDEKASYGMDVEKTAKVTSCLKHQNETVGQGKTFIAKGCNELNDFLVVPLKATGQLVGVITVHTVTNTEISDSKLQQSFSIIATSLAPHFQIGRDRAEKQDMQVSPFNAFITNIDENINKLREYNGTLAVTLVEATNYNDIREEKGWQEASNMVQQLAVTLSKKISVVNECTRIGLNTLAVLLPMHDNMETPEIINNALAKADTSFEFRTRTASFPENGGNAIEILNSMRP